MAAFDLKYGFDKVQMTPEFFAFRMRFLVEELFEIILAAEAHDPEGVVDGLIDLIVVAAGTLSIGNVHSQQAWDEVRRANMSKERRANPTRSGSGGADLVKPDGWTPPDHTENIGDLPGAIGPEFNKHFPHSISVMFEAIKKQFEKYEDYNNGMTDIVRGDYWIHGIDDLEYEMSKKLTRFRSVLTQLKAGKKPNFESIEDSLEDNINYHSFAVAYLRGKEPGQKLGRGLFNERDPRNVATRIGEIIGGQHAVEGTAPTT